MNLSSNIQSIAEVIFNTFDNFYAVVEPLLNIAQGASKLLGMFQ